MGEWTKRKKLILLGCFLTWVTINLLSVFTPLFGTYAAPGSVARGKNRPRILKPEGCTKNDQCPGGMRCRFDFDYKYYRTCECADEYSYMMQPPIFDENELDPTFSPFRDCKVLWQIGIGEIIWWTLYCIMSFRLSQYSIQTLVRVVKHNDKFTWNSTARALFLLNASSAWFGPMGIVFMLNILRLDPYDTLVDYLVFGFMLPVDSIIGIFLRYELPVAWIDLVLKTVKMSKKSTTSFKVLQFVIYAWVIMRMLVGPHLNLSQKAQKKYLDFAYYFMFVLFSVPGFILGRLLCKDMKNTSSPNWKVARIINRSWQIISLCTLLIKYLWMPQYVKMLYGPKGTRPFSLSIWCLWKAGDCVINYTALHYCLYGFRKYLQHYDTDYVSQYFGFSTVGLQSRADLSSSYVAPSSVSAVSSASVAAEADAEEGQKV